MSRFAAPLAVAAALFAPGAAGADVATPGADGLGDRLYPTLGNGGYDVLHYDLALRYATTDPSQAIDGDVTVTARATQSLSRFDLDFGGMSIGGVSVNGRAAAFKRNAEELIITPHDPLPKDAQFTVKVTHFTSAPTKVNGNVHSTAFFVTPDGSATAPQPNDAHLIYPCNDHPRDKATFSFTFDVPAGRTASGTADPTMPAAASEIVPSPPLATTTSRPRFRKVFTISVASPGPVVGALISSIPCPRARSMTPLICCRRSF